MASISDNFDRTNGAIGANWSLMNSPSFQIVANEVRQQTSSGAYRVARHVTPLDTADGSVTATLRCGDAASGVGLIMRLPGTGTAVGDIDGYGVVFFPGDRFYLMRWLDGDDGYGTARQLGSSTNGGSVSTGTNYTVTLEVIGSSIRVVIGGVERMTATDSNIAGGSGFRSVGLLAYGGANSTNAPYWNDFSAADNAAATNEAGLAAALRAPSPSAATSVETGAALAATMPRASLTAAASQSAAAIEAALSAALAASGLSSGVSVGTGAALAATLSAPALTSAVGVNTGAAVTAALSAPALVYGSALRTYGYADDRVDRVIIPQLGNPINVGGNLTYEVVLNCLYADNGTTATDVRYSNIVLDHDVWGDARGWCLGVTRRAGVLVLIFGAAGDSWAAIRGTSQVGDGVDHHIALTRNGTTGAVTLWLDGVSEATGTFNTSDWAVSGSPPGSGQDNFALVLGTEKHDYVPGDGGYSGQMDELRVSDIVRYTSTYTPALRHVVDGDTVALYHMDEGSGTTIVDAAGNQDGTLLVGGTPSGPVWVVQPHLALGDVPADNPLSLSGALPAVAVAAAASVTAQAQVAATLPPLSAAAAVAAAIQAGVAAGLPALGVAGAVAVTGDAALASGLPALTVTAVAVVDDAAGVAASLPALGVAATIDVEPLGNNLALSAALPAVSVAASAAVQVAGTVAAMLGAAVAASVAVEDGAALAASLPALTAAGSIAAEELGGNALALETSLPALAVAATAQVQVESAVTVGLGMSVVAAAEVGSVAQVSVTLSTPNLLTTIFVGVLVVSRSKGTVYGPAAGGQVVSPAASGRVVSPSKRR